MAEPESVIETRFAQVFPTFEAADVERLRRFGEERAYRTGDRLLTTGEVSPGIFVVTRGEVTVTQRNALGHEEQIVTHGPGRFIGELAQLSGAISSTGSAPWPPSRSGC